MVKEKKNVHLKTYKITSSKCMLSVAVLLLFGHPLVLLNMSLKCPPNFQIHFLGKQEQQVYVCAFLVDFVSKKP